LADAAHGFSERGDGPVGDADADAESDAADGAAAADKECEGDGEHHADWGNEGIGDFFVPLDGEGGDVKAGLVEAVDVTAKVAPAHLEGLDDLAAEVGGRLGEFGESGNGEGCVADDAGSGKIADPAGFKDPGLFGVEPARAGGEDAAAHLEGGGIEFEDGEAAEKFFVGIEEIKIVNLGIVTENPALGTGVSLRRLALDDGAKRVLALVGVGEIGVVQDEEDGGNGEASEEEREGESIEGEAAGLEGDDFIVFAENAEGDEHGDESAERGELVNGVGDEEAEIVDDDHEGDVVAADVFCQLEEGEDFEEEEERDHDEHEVVKETAEEIEVNDGWKAGIRGRSGRAIFRAYGSGAGFGAEGAAKKPPKGCEARDEGRDARFTAVALHAGKENESDEGDDEVCGPHADGGGDEALAGKAGAGDEKKIIRGDDDDGEERAGGAAAAAGLCTERDGDESEDEAGDREGEALVEFDARVTPVRAAVAQELEHGTFGIADGALLSGRWGAEFDGPVTAAEGSDGVMVWGGAGKFVSGAAVEMEFEFAESGLGNYNCGFRKSDLRVAAVRAGFGEEDAVPVGAAGGEVVDVEDEVREALVEDARLNGERDLGGVESTFDVAAGAEGERREPEGHERGENGADDCEKADGNENALAADAESGESDDLAVHGHAAEAEKDADEDGHGDGENEKAGDDAEEEIDDLGGGAGMADEDLHEANELGNEEDESENEEAEEGVASDFSGDVAVEDAHGEKGECNMGWSSHRGHGDGSTEHAERSRVKK
jgi:hypothetical protein